MRKKKKLDQPRQKRRKAEAKEKIYPSCEDVWNKYPTRYEGIIALAEEAERLFEITGERPSQLVYKSIDKLLFNKRKDKGKCKE